jgi:hypothetical protein
MIAESVLACVEGARSAFIESHIVAVKAVATPQQTVPIWVAPGVVKHGPAECRQSLFDLATARSQRAIDLVGKLGEDADGEFRQ